MCLHQQSLMSPKSSSASAHAPQLIMSSIKQPQIAPSFIIILRFFPLLLSIPLCSGPNRGRRIEAKCCDHQSNSSMSITASPPIYHLKLENSHCSAVSTSFRRTGLLWIYSIFWRRPSSLVTGNARPRSFHTRTRAPYSTLSDCAILASRQL